MKKFFTLLLSSLFSLSLFAFDGNRLSVSVISKKMDLKIEIDGKKYSMQEDNSFTLQNLREGNHSVKIYSEKMKGKGIFRSGRKQEVIFNSSVYLRRGFHIDITVNRFGKVFTDERRIDDNDNWNDEEYGYDDEDQFDGWKAVSDDEFYYMKEQIRKEWFETQRLSIAKVSMEGEHFTAKQVKELMFLFTFESNRLDIAKFAYRMTIDKEHYYMLNDALTFNTSKDELARFIRESR
ncbi:MAG: DUF4476 domain-containing protein [Chitinophagaceae bacterium]|nr:DUF4476 domain-containing protein [Chitinophagaceae bacterium]